MTNMLIQRVGCLAIAVALAACGAQPRMSPGQGLAAQSGLATFDEGGLVFEYPATWRVFHHDERSSFSNLIAFLATVDVPTPCATSQINGGTQIECADRFHLDPNTIVVKVEGNAWPGFDILGHPPAGATAVTIGDLPGYVEAIQAPPQTGADRAMRWTISRPGMVDNYFTLTAIIRGPDVERLKTEAETMVSSLRYDPPPVPLPAGATAAAAAASKALALLDTSDSGAWRCFPARPGSRQMRVSSLPMGPPLARSQLATCTTRIEATPLELWRMTFTIRLSEPDHAAGSGAALIVWVGPDGSPLTVSGSQLQP